MLKCYIKVPYIACLDENDSCNQEFYDKLDRSWKRYVVITKSLLTIKANCSDVETKSRLYLTTNAVQIHIFMNLLMLKNEAQDLIESSKMMMSKQKMIKKVRYGTVAPEKFIKSEVE